MYNLHTWLALQLFVGGSLARARVGEYSSRGLIAQETLRCTALCCLNMLMLRIAGMGGHRAEVTEEGVAWVREALGKAGGSRVPTNFEPTAPVHNPAQQRGRMPQKGLRNPQTLALLRLLDLPYNLEPQSEDSAGEPSCLPVGKAIVHHNVQDHGARARSA